MRAWRHWLWSAVLVPGVLGAQIRVVGSDLLGRRLAADLRKFAQKNGLVLTVDFTGSVQGWAALRAGRADVALLSFAPGEPLPAPPFCAIPAASYTAVLLVPATLPLSQVSYPQLAGVFGNAEGAAGKHWSDLGVTGEIADRSMRPRRLADQTGLAGELFRHEVLGDRPFRPGLATDPTAAQLAAHVLAEEGGIALAPLPLAGQPGVKALAVSRAAGGAAYAPTEVNVQRGDYPLRWPVYLVFRRAEAKTLYPILRHLLGDAVAADCRLAGLMPAPAAVREEAVFGLEQL
jgi:phosphate transport system substrate-binding protein